MSRAFMSSPRYDSAVFTLMSRSFAISFVVWPSAMSCSTSRCHCVTAVFGFAHDFNVVDRLQQCADAGTEQLVIVREQHADRLRGRHVVNPAGPDVPTSFNGTEMRIWVPRPGPESISRSPPRMS